MFGCDSICLYKYLPMPNVITELESSTELPDWLMIQLGWKKYETKKIENPISLWSDQE